MTYITCSRMFCLSISLLATLTGLKYWNPRENVTDILYATVWENAHKSSRYSNTLLVSLNNRIYFRDHSTSGVHVDTDHYVDTGDQFHRSATTSLHFAQVGSPTHTTARGDNIKLNTVSHTIGFDFEKGKGDAVSICSDPKC